MKYIIVQAGGRGSRLKYLTDNKPKALVPVENMPMLFYLFKKFVDRHFIIIADYKRDVLKKYLAVFAEVDYEIVESDEKGTCGGISPALEKIPDDESFMIIWSDLILPVAFDLPKEYQEGKAENNYVGISETFPCRWKFENDHFSEERSEKFGVAGMFLFKDKAQLGELPLSGEFVRFLSEADMKFKSCGLRGTREFGLIEEYEKLSEIKCRPFNKTYIEDNKFHKIPVNKQGENLAKIEIEWYKKLSELGVDCIPKVYSYEPLCMEYISGGAVHEAMIQDKERLLKNIVDALKSIHEREHVSADKNSMHKAYFEKTMQRLSRVFDLVPFGKAKKIIVNGRECRNVYYYKDLLEEKIDQIACSNFSIIHGDCTFSNIMIKNDIEPILIDPRGYFGDTKIYGDSRYDWAKLYYSIVGNYDKFNLKKFSLEIGGGYGKEDSSLKYGEVELKIKSNGWEELREKFFEFTGVDEYEIKLIHAVIWLSLTTYAWQDYDSVCGAFYNGLYYLEEVL